MKGSIVLIIIGGLLLLEGTARIYMGIIGGGTSLVAGGFFSGWFLGGYLFFRGIRRANRIKGTLRAKSEGVKD